MYHVYNATQRGVLPWPAIPIAMYLSQAAVLEGVLATSEASSSQLLSEGVTDHVTVRRTMSVGRKHPPQATELEPIIRVIKFKKLNT